MKSICGIVVLSLLMLGAPARAASDPQVGQWKMDLAASKYVTAALPQSSEAVVEPDGPDGVKLTVNMVNAKGEPFFLQYSAQYDGKPYPRTEVGPGAVPGQTVTLKRIDARTVERVLYREGKAVGTERWAISADGQTRTVTQFGTDFAGKPIDNLQIYRKR